MKIQENIASTIRAVMRERELTITEAAEEFCISRTALQSYLKADSNPRSDTIELLSQKLGLTAAELVSGMKEVDIPCRDKLHPVFEPFIEDIIHLSAILYTLGMPEDIGGGKDE
mgnify:FL=1